MAKVLSMESDGQISFVMPEREAVEKQITGQMSIEDILLEWERMKKQNEEKRKADKSNTEKPRQLNTNSIKNLEDKLYNVLNTKDEELLELYRGYIEMRERINTPLTENGLERLVERAKRYAKNNVRVEKLLLETATINNWKNVYMPRESELQAVTQEITEDLRELFGLE